MDNFTSDSGDVNSTISDSNSCDWPPEEVYNFSIGYDPTIYVELVCYPILLVLCTVGNILGIIVLSTDVAKTTTNVYLICLAVSDLCIL